MTAPTRWALRTMMDLAARGMGKIDLYGSRGATLVSQDEIEAMAGALAVLGLRAIHPAVAEFSVPDTRTNTLKGPTDV
ncbi:hypothetical protein [Pararhodobacter sp.]|uniref:hypothetical protein n=1 Tax=Pararhodobacter sp. TaxID=2127056 RepID=UPI002AFE2530|nr:hypothetical protein [Pararhodobacter sp.]